MNENEIKNENKDTSDDHVDENEIKNENKDTYKDTYNYLAMDLFCEIKAQTKRWMVAFLVVIVMWFMTIIGFVWYMSLYDFSSYSQDGTGYNTINTGTQGDVNNGATIETTETEER